MHGKRYGNYTRRSSLHRKTDWPKTADSLYFLLIEHMKILLGCGDAAMSHKGRDRLDIRAFVEHVDGKRMSGTMP